jgi:hypothetical protein
MEFDPEDGELATKSDPLAVVVEFVAGVEACAEVVDALPESEEGAIGAGRTWTPASDAEDPPEPSA